MLITHKGFAIGYYKSHAASGCKRSLAGPMGQPDIHYWPKGPAKDCSGHRPLQIMCSLEDAKHL